jgi:hypothetical protein
MGRKIRKIKGAYRKLRKAYRIVTFPIRGAVRFARMASRARKHAHLP